MISERSGADVGIPVELTLKGKPEPVAARLVRIAAPGTPGDAGPGWGVVSG